MKTVKDLPFEKYQGTGNDFVLVADPDGRWEMALDRARIAALCDRHFGIGADGLILLQQTGGYDFRMVYYNADGAESTFCGNGSRCAVAFARSLGWTIDKAWFVAADGDHEARIDPDGHIAVHMRSVREVTPHGEDDVLDTGSPHLVRWVADPESVDLVRIARKIRYAPPFAEAGINVNLVRETEDGILQMRTYERGVEAETLSCGTGVTAAAVSWVSRKAGTGKFDCRVLTRGGALTVHLEAGSWGFRDIWLHGPAEPVFRGVWPWR